MKGCSKGGFPQGSSTLRKPVLVAGVVASFTLAACGGSGGDSGDGGSGEEIRLTVADIRSPENFAITEGLQPWMDRITELTDGQVQFDFYPAEQLGSQLDMLAMAADGTTDVAYTPPASFTGEMRLSEVHTIPGLFSDSVEASRAFDAASRETAIAEIDYARNGLHYLWGYMTFPSEVFTVDAPIRGIEDFKGLTLRGSGGLLETTVARLGATSMTLPTSEVYQALETGTTDGTIMQQATVVSFSLGELIGYATEGWNMGSYWAPYSMNADVYDGLPDDVKEAIATANGEAIARLSKVTQEQTVQARETALQHVEFSPLPPGDKEELFAIYEAVENDWVAAAEKEGLPAEATLQFVREQLAE